jgi:hypothetical protein
MRTTALGYLAAAAAVLLTAGAPEAAAQSKSVVRSGSIEIGPFLGASYGIDQTRFMGGGNVTFAVNKYLLPYAEFSYFPGIGRSTSGTFSGTGRPYTTTYSLPLSDFHGGVHIRLPVFHEKPVVPYLVFGVGGLKHFDRTVNATYTDASGTSTQLPLTVAGGTDFAFNTGGGIRFYIGQRFGLRVEAKAYKPSGDYPDVFGKVEAGFFFQLR